MLKERVIRWSGPTALALVLVMLVMGQASKPSPVVHEEVWAKKFGLVGPDGEARGMWACNRDTTCFRIQPRLPASTKPQSAPGVMLIASPDGHFLHIGNPAPERSVTLRAGFRADAPLDVGLLVYDQHGRTRLVIGTREEGMPIIGLLDANQTPRVELGGVPGSPFGAPSESTLLLWDKDGKATWQFSDENSPLR